MEPNLSTLLLISIPLL